MAVNGNGLRAKINGDMIMIKVMPEDFASKGMSEAITWPVLAALARQHPEMLSPIAGISVELVGEIRVRVKVGPAVPSKIDEFIEQVIGKNGNGTGNGSGSTAHQEEPLPQGF